MKLKDARILFVMLYVMMVTLFGSVKDLKKKSIDELQRSEMERMKYKLFQAIHFCTIEP